MGYGIVSKWGRLPKKTCLFTKKSACVERGGSFGGIPYNGSLLKIVWLMEFVIIVCKPHKKL